MLITAFRCWKQQCNPSCTKINPLSYYVNQVGLKLVIPLPQPPSSVRKVEVTSVYHHACLPPE